MIKTDYILFSILKVYILTIIENLTIINLKHVKQNHKPEVTESVLAHLIGYKQLLTII
jgi:hypothetical protein